MAVRYRNLAPKLHRGLRPEAREKRRRRRLAPLHHELPVAPGDVRGARRLLLAIAAVVALVDLGEKAISPRLPEFFHPRPLAVVAAMIAATALGFVVIPRAGSRVLAVCGGLMVGGGVANTVSLVFWGRGIPNPLVSYRFSVAFNLADVCVLAGFVLLLPATLVYALQHRDELGARLF